MNKAEGQQNYYQVNQMGKEKSDTESKRPKFNSKGI